jgi:hypothetical protein
MGSTPELVAMGVDVAHHHLCGRSSSDPILVSTVWSLQPTQRAASSRSKSHQTPGPVQGRERYSSHVARRTSHVARRTSRRCPVNDGSPPLGHAALHMWSSRGNWASDQDFCGGDGT